MSDQQTQNEPSMEEILASIRKIISEEDGDEEATEAAAEPEAAEEAPPPEEDDDDDILDLTQMIDEGDNVVELATEAADSALPDELSVEVEEEPEPEPEAAEPEEPEPEPDSAEDEDPFAAMVAESEPEEPVADDEEPAAEGLVSAATAAAATATLGEVAQLAAESRGADLRIGGGRTLEDLAREAMTPLLKAWLDENLAPLVERVVREEVRRLARRAEDD